MKAGSYSALGLRAWWSHRSARNAATTIALVMTVATPAHRVYGESKTLSATLTLNKDETWQVASLVLDKDADIQTNGHRLTISVEGDLHSESGAKIQRGADSTQSSSDVPPRAADGKSFDPGPNTSGQGERKDGRAGGDGAPGADGQPGMSGRSGDDVTIIVGGTATGSLIIDETGEPGGNGAKGGDGGAGGNGEQGGRGEPNKVFGVIVGAKAGPASGGKGGDGGRGGKGGDGGNGGDGGRVIVSVRQPSPQFALICRTNGGAPGSGGEGGTGGNPGTPGFGGRGGPGISGRENERKGPVGKPGASGQRGVDGSQGQFVRPEILGDIGSVLIVDSDGQRRELER